MSEKATEPDIELRCVNVAEVPQADIQRRTFLLKSLSISELADSTSPRGLGRGTPEE
jgi:hypothetical protein